MKKLITLLLILSYFNVSAQDKLSVFGEVSTIAFKQMNYTIDANYKLSDYTTLSSWSSTTTGRTAAQVFDYTTSSLMLNFGKKDNPNTFSVGYTYLGVPNMNIEQSALMIKVRFKLL